MAAIDKLFTIMLKQGASDLHLLQGEPPKTRIHGVLRPIEGEPLLTGEQMSSYLQEICTTSQWQNFSQIKDLDFAYSYSEQTRFRANFYTHHRGYGAVFRQIPVDILTFEELNLPESLKNLCDLRSGLVLVTGPTGSGKSTTLAAIIDHINRHQARYILTIEEPIEFIHRSRKSYFCQREVGRDTASFGEALYSATRQDCDVILVGEMRDYETISLALSAASTGILVFGTLHTNSAVKTVDRIIDVFPADQQGMARTMLSDTLQGVCAQLLFKTADGKGRLAINEILLASRSLSTSIREGNTANIRNVIQSGRKAGMKLMDDAIAEALAQKKISKEEAYLKATDKSRFQHLIKDSNGEKNETKGQTK